MVNAQVQIIGIDCATDEARIGLARGTAEGPELHILQAQQCSSNQPAARTVAQWVADSPHAHTLLAIDAPLGWPEALGRALTQHQAGDAIDADAHALFRREIIAALRREGVRLPDLPVLEQSAEALNAAVCLVAAHEVPLGHAMPPPNLDLARREGWILARHHSDAKQPYV